MPEVGFTNLLVVCLVALVAPLLLGFAPRLRIPAVVLEIVTGVVVGPRCPGGGEDDTVGSDVPGLGLQRLRGPVLRLAFTGYVVSLALGLGVGGGLTALDWVGSPVLLAVALSA